MRYVMKLNVADLAATRFTTSPLSETVAAVRLLGNPRPPGVNLPWVRWAQRELERRPLRMPRLWPLALTGLPYFPEFLIPFIIRHGAWRLGALLLASYSALGYRLELENGLTAR